jgi:AraC-like DNA-binding protein
VDGARIWQADDLGGVELLSATFTEFVFHPHAHEEFFVALTEGGRALATYRGGTRVVGPGEMVVLNPGEAHQGGPPTESSWTYRALYPPPGLMSELAGEFPAHARAEPGPRFGGDVVRDREVAAHLRRFHRLTETPGSSRLEREAHLAEALVLLIGRHAAPPRDPRDPGRERTAVRLAKEYLQAHAIENVTLGEVAGAAGLSAFHLCRVFRDTVGMTPHAFQTQVRVWQAKRLLLSGLPITRAATESGFYDQAHFTRHFKRLMGITPGQYLRQNAPRSLPSGRSVETE